MPPFNQYNVGVSQPPRLSFPSGFGQLIAQKFGGDSVVVIASEQEELERQFRDAGLPVSVYGSAGELLEADKGKSAGGSVAIWFYPGDENSDRQTIQTLAALAENIVLVPENGVDVAERRPRLVAGFAECGLLPDYGFDLSAVGASTIRLTRTGPTSVQAIVPEVESAMARLQKEMRGLERALRTRMAELEAADRHISKLEEKLLKWKEAKQQLKQLKAEKQALRKSPERKVGQVLLAPYLLPQKLVREVRKRFPGSGKGSRGGKPVSEYQQWFHGQRAKPADLEAMRVEIAKFDYQPCVSIITPVFNTPVEWLEQCVQSVVDQVYHKWELILVDDQSTDAETLRRLPELAARDSRIVLTKSDKRGGISGASNRGLERAEGEWIGFLDHDDMLEPDAVFQHIKWLQEHRDADLIYSDEDKLTEEGLDSPIFKPDWSPDYFLS